METEETPKLLPKTVEGCLKVVKDCYERSFGHTLEAAKLITIADQMRQRAVKIEIGEELEDK